MLRYKADVVVVGGGLAGLCASLELLEKKKRVLLIDRDTPEKLGGLAKESFGGIFVVGSKEQKRGGFKDSVDIAWEDWLSTAEFSKEDVYPKKWTRYFLENHYEEVYLWLKKKLGISFLPVVHWVERGLFRPGNSFPRFHIIWGTGKELIERILFALENHPNRKNLEIFFHHRARRLIKQGGRIQGVAGIKEDTKEEWQAFAEEGVVLATGGISGGDLKMYKKYWYKEWGKPPKKILNGSHQYAEGDHIQMGIKVKAKITHLDLQWNYAAGVHHPNPPYEGYGISLVPPRSALWVNYKGERFQDPPLITGFDTRYLVERIIKEGKPYSWLILNYKIAKKELAVSGAEFNDAIREKKRLSFLRILLLGNKKLVDYLLENCPDFLSAYSLEDLVSKMHALVGKKEVDYETLEKEILAFDRQMEMKELSVDDQIRRIALLRKYRGDRLRILPFQKILDPSAYPLIAIRCFIITRKTLGGLVTDLNSQVLDTSYKPIPHLFAVGESAGFGGGGIHGKRALEGTFLAGCIFTGRTCIKNTF